MSSELEEGVPFPEDRNQLQPRSSEVDPNRIEDRKDWKMKYGSWLALGCLGFLCFAYLVNFFCTSKSSDITDSIVEIAKTVLLTVLGYLYGSKDE